MNWPNAYEAATVDKWLERLNNLKPDTQPQWGKMNAGQLLAHLNVTYAMVKGETKPQNKFVQWLMKKTIKKAVVGPKPYPKNSRTAPDFLVSEEQDYQQQKTLFIENIKWAQTLGAAHFEGHPSPSFGPMTAEEWSVTFSKHIEHHFEQFAL